MVLLRQVIAVVSHSGLAFTSTTKVGKCVQNAAFAALVGFIAFCLP